MIWSSPNDRVMSLPAGRPWYPPATAPPKYAPTTTPRGGSPITASIYTIYNLSAYMDGDIQGVIDQLMVTENAERMKETD